MRWGRSIAAWVIALGMTPGCDGQPAPASHAQAAFQRLGAPGEAAGTLSDLVSHRGTLYGVANRQPLAGGQSFLFATRDGLRFETLTRPGASEGLLHIRTVRGRLWIPDADPAGRTSGRIYALHDDGALEAEAIENALHTYDAIEFGGELLTSNGMRGGRGALLKRDAPARWSEVATADTARLKQLATFRGTLFAAKRRSGSGADYFRWTETPARGPGEPVDGVEGEATTFRWHVSGRGRLFWSLLGEGGFQVLVSDDGTQWQAIPELAGQFVSAFADWDGAVYALADSGLLVSRDHARFELAVPAPDPATFGPVHVSAAHANSDAVASLTVHDGSLWCGSSTDGHLYRVTLEPSGAVPAQR